MSRNKKIHSAYNKQWAKDNPEKIREYSRSYVKKDPKKRNSIALRSYYLARVRNPLRSILKTAKHRAKEHGITFELSELDFIYLPLFCPIFGIRLQYWNPKASDDSASLDRINADFGYIPGNVQIISWRANQVKSNGTAQEHFLIYQQGYVKNSLTTGRVSGRIAFDTEA
jgi:hypothetical protein